MRFKAVPENAVFAQDHWIHFLAAQVHPLRKLKTQNFVSGLTLTANIVGPQEMPRLLKGHELVSTEGFTVSAPLETLGAPEEVSIKEVIEFPTPGRIFPLNCPRYQLRFLCPDP